MANNQKVRATYENLFQKLVSTAKGNQKINNFIRSFQNASMLPIKLAEARVSLSVSSKSPPKKKAAKATGVKRTTTTRKRKKAD